ncbi:ATP-binding protein [Roseateles amylovorans]|uniref:histidine kinase n=1 Tax=Roseateles amylovorans TaxID=2978473 RepID=A0ABY6AXU4_9BURK|nr:ATP-binding protein [Roseateles amylovorans]UXH77400.1 GAF domain-containing protein [Roseateles amylovorans]
MPHRFEAAEVSLPDLRSCADEPIHIPGSIQPHGLLIALRDGVVAAWSENVQPTLGLSLTLGQAWLQVSLPAAVHEAISRLMSEAQQMPGVPTFAEVELAGQPHDIVVHEHDGHCLIEFEPRAEPVLTHMSQVRVFDRLRRATSLEAVLQLAVETIRMWTSFDRVMAYRFRHDESGEVQAEAKSNALSSYLGLRYPASDIPAQARRLYLLNTLRLIPHVSYRAIPLVGHPSAPPLDLTHSVLRSVSPIHVEYLHNMGVGASMSISLVVNDRLWGLIACHHMSSLKVPYPVRSDCDVLAQVISSAISTLETRDFARRQALTASLIGELVADLTIADDAIVALAEKAERLKEVLRADALVMTQNSRVMATSELSHDLAVMIATASWTGDLPLSRDCRGDWPDALRDTLGPWVGALRLDFEPAGRGSLIALRREQTETVRWAGQPDKVIARGPNGPRLTPRGSFTEWRQHVKDCADPWTESDLVFARQLMLELQRTAAARHVEMEEARRNLLAMLGHDLRDPLQAITMVASVLKRGEDSGRLGARLDASSGRMHRLITQVLDFSRAEVGMPLVAEAQRFDLDALLQDLVEEVRVGHPGFDVTLTTCGEVVVTGDAIRLAQAMSNLIANARNHGAPGRPVRVELTRRDDEIRFDVFNEAAPIDPALVADLFEPFKRGQAEPRRNRSGLGLGLYIAKRIVTEHGGTLSYGYEDQQVRFGFSLAREGLAPR